MPFHLIVPKKDGTPAWLYENLRKLLESQTATEQAVAAINRGETPDGSGAPLVDQTKFLYKPGLIGGQVAHGAIDPGGSLTLSSTANTSRGSIFFGEAQTSAYDEANDRLGMGIAIPTARVHIFAPVPATIFTLVTPDISGGGGWGLYSDDGTPPTSYFQAWNGDDGSHSYAGRNGGVGGGAFTAITHTSSALGAGATSWNVDYKARKLGNPQWSGLYLVLYDANGVPWDTPGTLPTSQFSSSTWQSFSVALTGNPQNLGVTPARANTVGFVITYQGSDPDYFLVTYLRVRAQASGPGGRTLSVQGQVSQNEPLTEWLDSIGNALAQVTSGGQMLLGNISAGAAVTKLFIQGSISQSVDLFDIVDSNALTLLSVASTGRLILGNTGTGAAVTKLTIQGTAAQSVNLLEILSSTPSTLLSVSSAGKLVLNVGFQLTPGGATGAVLTSDASGNGTWGTASALATRVQFEWRANGPFQTGTEVDGQVRIPTGFTITNIRLYRKTAGSSGSTIVDFNKNAVTMFTTQANRPTITAASGNNQASSGTLPDITSVAAGDVLSLDIDQIEGGTPSDCVLIIEGA